MRGSGSREHLARQLRSRARPALRASTARGTAPADSSTSARSPEAPARQTCPASAREAAARCRATSRSDAKDARPAAPAFRSACAAASDPAPCRRRSAARCGRGPMTLSSWYCLIFCAKVCPLLRPLGAFDHPAIHVRDVDRAVGTGRHVGRAKQRIERANELGTRDRRSAVASAHRS